MRILQEPDFVVSCWGSEISNLSCLGRLYLVFFAVAQNKKLDSVFLFSKQSKVLFENALSNSEITCPPVVVAKNKNKIPLTPDQAQWVQEQMNKEQPLRKNIEVQLGAFSSSNYFSVLVRCLNVFLHSWFSRNGDLKTPLDRIVLALQKIEWRSWGFDYS